MIFEILIVLITTLIGYYFYKHRQVQDFFKSRGVKFIPGMPFFGNMYHSTFWKKHFLDELQEVHDAFPDEKYVGFVEFTLPILLIRDPELIKTITVKDFDHFTDHRGFFSEDADPLLSGSLLLMKGEIWREMRTTLSPAFTASKMKLMYPIIVENANKIIEYLQGHEHQNIEVDDLMRRYSNDVSASAGFGLQINSLKDRDNEFYKIGSTLFHFDMKQRMILMLFALFPTLCKKSGMRLFPKRTNDFFRNIVGSTMEYRKKEQVERPDMIQLLMEAKKGWTANDLTAQVFIFFAAGFDSSASALVMAIHELAINPDVQEKLYQECRKLKEENQKDGGLSFDKLGELKYLEWVISVETW